MLSGQPCVTRPVGNGLCPREPVQSWQAGSLELGVLEASKPGRHSVQRQPHMYGLRPVVTCSHTGLEASEP